jgi:hypothetical protein
MSKAMGGCLFSLGNVLGRKCTVFPLILAVERIDGDILSPRPDVALVTVFEDMRMMKDCKALHEGKSGL